MNSKINRRQFGLTAIMAGIGTSTLARAYNISLPAGNESHIIPALKNRIALNAYSFNTPLRDGSMNLFDLLNFCSETGFDGVDLTGYYFPGYPDPPPDEYIYDIKKRAFTLGLNICGTGVRNDFCYADPAVREKEKDLVKSWIQVAKKLGAPSIRIFSGKGVPEGYTWNQVSKWVTKDIQECAEFGRNHGVMIEIQNHNDFLKTADEVNTLLEMINSEWVGLKLDIGSYRTADPYIEIAETIKYAVSWQLKENVFIKQVETPVDLTRLKGIIANSEFKGYIPIETLGEGDPFVKVKNFYKKVIAAFKSS